MNEYQFSDLHVGLTHSFKKVVTSGMMDKFLEISSDTNPLHLHDEYARKRGFDGRVVYGLLTSSFFSTLAGVYLPGKLCLLHGINLRFSKPVYICDELTIAGKISYINESNKQIEIQVSITNQHNQAVSRGILKTGMMDG